MKASDTAASRSHVKAHQQALMLKRANPELFPEDQQDVPFGPQGNEKELKRPARAGAIAPSQTSNGR